MSYDLLSVADDGSVRTGLRCTQCELSKCSKLVTNCMPGTGPKDTLMFCGFAPGEEDDRIGEAFTGLNGRMLRDYLKEVGFNTAELRFTNCLRCHLFETTPQKRHWDKCKSHLLRELRKYTPRAIVAMGGKAFSWLTGFQQMHKFKRVGIPCLLDPNIMVYAINQPVMQYKVDWTEQDRVKTEILEDLMWLKAAWGRGDLEQGSEPPTDYKTAYTVQEVKDFLAEFEGIGEVCFDLETCDKDFNPTVNHRPDDTFISMVSISAGPGHARAIPLYAKGITDLFWWSEEDYDIVFNLVKGFFLWHGRKLFGQNAVQFDQNWLRWKFRNDRGLQLPRFEFTYDTMYASHLLDPDKMGHGLEYLAVKYGNMLPWKPQSLTKLMKDTRNLALYACRDVDATYRVRNGSEMLLTDKQKWLLHNILIPEGQEFAEVEHRGIPLDEANVNKFGEYVDKLLTKYTKELRQLEVVKRYEAEEEKVFNPNAPHQVARVMEYYLKLKCIERTGKGEYSTAAKVLEEHKGESTGFVEKIYYIRKLDKLRGTYYTTFKECLPVAYPRININGTVTGRPASSNPNVYNVPREDTAKKAGLDDPKVIKATIGTSGSGRKLLAIDLSQIELRVLAILSGDDALMRAYLDGIDLHRQTASVAFGVPYEEVTSGQRYQSKAVNFQVPYGASEKAIVHGFVERQRHLAREDGNTWTREDEEKAKHDGCAFLVGHRKAYPKVWAYMENCVARAQRYRYQETPFGRRKYYRQVDSAAKRQAQNFEIQSSASDIAIMGMLRSNEAIRQLNLDAKLLIFLYDAVIYDVADADLALTAKVVKAMMESVGKDLDWVTVPIVADVEVGPNWGELEKWDAENA